LHETKAPIGSLGLYIKGNVLLGRVINWTQRESPFVFSRRTRELTLTPAGLPRYAVAPEGQTCSTMKNKIKESCVSMPCLSSELSLTARLRRPEFKELDFALSKFRTTVSGNFIDAGNQIDGYLASSYAIPHV
jgi:hypothetical protein